VKGEAFDKFEADKALVENEDQDLVIQQWNKVCVQKVWWLFGQLWNLMTNKC
jgi:hypothetical protein